MGSIAEAIAAYIKEMLSEATDGTIEIRRCELAEQFRCVPSQINYVLGTRFTTERGYLVESRRGGGGHIRITRLHTGSRSRALYDLLSLLGREIDERRAKGLIGYLLERGFLNRREAELMEAIIKKETLEIHLPYRDIVRANILRALVKQLLKASGETEKEGGF